MDDAGVDKTVRRDRRRVFSSIGLFYVTMSIIIVLVIVAIYLGVYIRNNNLLENTVKKQAASYFDLIVTSRGWNARYGGIFVEKVAGVESNQYLRQVGVNPDVTAADGRVFTLKNPALMTRELSERLKTSSQVRFHISSPKFLNPANAPDAFELRAFAEFEKGAKEFADIVDMPEGTYFRYMGPLKTEASCLKCHGAAGYKVGDIRGGISVNIPFGPIRAEQAKTRTIIWALGGATIALLLGSSLVMLIGLARKLQSAQELLRQASITDPLTGIPNRRHIMQRVQDESDRCRRKGASLGLLMVDVDHFKSVNDTHGHLVGDKVLAAIAARLKKSLRAYDCVGRYGGEEFLVMMSETQGQRLGDLAERLRATVAAEPVADGDKSFGVTVSIGGVAGKFDESMAMSARAIDALVNRADEALYQAKRQGRNRVVIAPADPRGALPS